MARKKSADTTNSGGNAPGPLGFIPRDERTPEQEEAHELALARMPKFAITGRAEPTAKVDVRLYRYWEHPDVIADTGIKFTRFLQHTGSCVGVGAGDMMYTLGCVQRVVSDNPTRAFIPWWPYPYGRSRLRAGMRNPGEGSLGSTMAEALIKDGVFDARDPKLPKYSDKGDEGFQLTSQLEIQWSDGDSATVMPWNELAAQHPVGVAAPCQSAEDIKNAITNGYPCTIAHGMFVGKGRVQGTGENACVVGKFDSRGGHQTSIIGFWDHPTLGWLFLNLNQWPSSTYPRDPAGAPICSIWHPRDDLDRAMRDRNFEAFAFSNYTTFPAQPKVLRHLIQP